MSTTLRLVLSVMAVAVLVGASLKAQDQVWQQMRDAGQTALDQGDLQAAETQWVAAYNEARIIGVQTLRFAESQRNLASLYVLTFRLDEAGAMLHDAQTLMKASGATVEYDWEMRLVSGELRLAQSNLAEARLDLTQALQSASTLGEDHPKTAITLAILGEMWREAFSSVEAAENLRLATGILSEIYGSRNVRTVSARVQWSRALLAQGRYDDAGNQAAQAVDAAQKMGPAGRLVEGDAFFALGCAYLAADMQQEASNSLQKALADTTAAFGAQSLHNVPILTALAELAVMMHDPQKASDWLRLAHALYESNPIPDWLPMARVFLADARVAIESHKSVEVDVALRQAETISVHRFEGESLLTADILKLRGDLRFAANELDQADSAYRHSMTLREKNLATAHPDLARSLVDVALVYQRRGQPKLAEDLFKRAIKNLETGWGNDSFGLVPTLLSYEFFLQLQKRNEEAQGVEDRIARLRAGRKR